MHENDNPQAHIQHPEAPSVVSREEYGCAYQQWFQLTVRFLGSKGLSSDTATEIAQSTWTRGWERRRQLRDSAYLLTWVNSIEELARRSTPQHTHRPTPR